MGNWVERGPHTVFVYLVTLSPLFWGERLLISFILNESK